MKVAWEMNETGKKYDKMYNKHSHAIPHIYIHSINNQRQ